MENACPACLAAFDAEPTDNDVDLDDFAAFQVLFYSAPICGNGVVEDDEDCDDEGESVDCDADCTFAECGDGVLNVTRGEECDDEGETATCDIDCTFADCGDGTLNVTAGEECDDGNTDSGDGCSADCTLEPLPSCLIDFDPPNSCPDVVETCGALFSGGLGCQSSAMCANTNGYNLDFASPTVITFSGDVEKITVTFSGFFGTAQMYFYDEFGVPVDTPLATNADCLFDPIAPQTVVFSRPVRIAEVYMSPGSVAAWIDDFWINPP